MAGEEGLFNRRITRSMAAKAKAVEEEAAATEKKSRMPQEDVDRILARVIELPRFYEDLKIQNPDLIPSPEEELDQEMVEFYEEGRALCDSVEDHREFQAWVRSEYQKNGYVELDDDYLAKVEEAKASREEFRKEIAQVLADDL